MQIHVDNAWVVAVLLVAIRVGMLFYMTPAFGSVPLPAQARVLLTLALSATLAGMLAHPAEGLALRPLPLALAAMAEVVTGGLLAFGLMAGFGAFLFAGRLLDMQIGFGVASLLDPASRTQEPLLGVVLNLLAVFLFFAVDGHHLILRGLAWSLEKVPPGAFASRADLSAVCAMFGRLFATGFALAAPVVFGLLMADLALAVMSRAMPQINVFVLSMSVKIVAGLLLLALSVPAMAPVMKALFDAIFRYWQDVMGAAG